MIDHITLKDSKTLEIQVKTSEEAIATCQNLGKFKEKENALARKNTGLPTDYNISADGSKVIISGSVFFALATFKKHNALSEERRHILSVELNKLRQSDKIAYQLAPPGTYAKRQMSLDEKKKKQIEYQRITAKTQALIDQQNQEDSEDDRPKTNGLPAYKSHL